MFGKAYLDGFVLSILATGALALLAPATGGAGDVLGVVVTVSIAALFFGYGARIPTAEALAGLRHWRLHVVILATTFVIFPVLGVLVDVATSGAFPRELSSGLLYLTLVPSTVQSSIVFTSVARGNVPGAVVSASVSNLLGVVLTPALALLLMSTTGRTHIKGDAIVGVSLQLLLPFLLGQAARPWLKGFVAAHAGQLKHTDRLCVLLVVYLAFSQDAAQGVWHRLSAGDLVGLVVLTGALLGAVLLITGVLGRALRFDRADRVVISFCGSKKSLASGLPMASVLFAGQPVGLIVLPLMVFHQIQLLVCGILAQRWGRTSPVPDPHRLRSPRPRTPPPPSATATSARPRTR